MDTVRWSLPVEDVRAVLSVVVAKQRAARWKAAAKVFRLRYRFAVGSYELEIAELETALAIAEQERDELAEDLAAERKRSEDVDE